MVVESDKTIDLSYIRHYIMHKTALACSKLERYVFSHMYSLHIKQSQNALQQALTCGL